MINPRTEAELRIQSKTKTKH